MSRGGSVLRVVGHEPHFAIRQDGVSCGSVLAAAEFDADAYDDLAVGAPKYGCWMTRL